VQEFKDLFEELFIKGLPPFWDGKGKLYDQEEYNARLTQCRMDHSKFETLEENLKGATLVEHLITDFEILNQFKAVKIGLMLTSKCSVKCCNHRFVSQLGCRHLSPATPLPLPRVRLHLLRRCCQKGR
jgi:hypothetical protein